jgi:UDP-4-amino-4,6-dideoxy-N-acetyl-beta-L-altrosamine transaminase
MSGSDGGGVFLPYAHQLVEADDVAAVAEVLRSAYLTTGPVLARFEAAFARAVGARHAVACSSGTAALHLAVMALDLGPGDLAIVPSMTFLATANVVRFVGAEVLFADVDPDSGMITPETVSATFARAAGGKVKAILPVHLGGAAPDLAAIAAVVQGRGVSVVEDACHALGATSAGGRIGDCSRSIMAAFSTHPAKAITTGEGGVVTLNDEGLAARLARLRSHGMDYEPHHWHEPERGAEAGVPAPWYYEMAEIGCNYRLTDIACALGLSQLGKLERFLVRRTALAARYDRLIAALAPYVRPPLSSPDAQSGWHLYSARIDFDALGTTRSLVMRRLRERGIGTQVHYIPVHMQPYYRQRYGALSLPGAETYYRRTLSLPLYAGMSDGDVERVVTALAESLGLG